MLNKKSLLVDKNRIAPLSSAYTLQNNPLLAQLTLDLQKYLIPEAIISQFASKIQSTVHFDGIFYHNPNSDFQLLLGAQKTRLLKYQLHDIGYITFFRSKNFSLAEKNTLELLLSALIQPLSNALQYQITLQSIFVDPLSHIPNRQALHLNLSRILKGAKRYNHLLTLLMLDLDNFKSINDYLGHQQGDNAIIAIASSISNQLRDSDTAFRLAGDEFVILLRKTSLIGAVQVAERLHKNLQSTLDKINRQFSQKSHKPSVSISIGLAPYLPNDTSKTLLNRADKALYRAKRAGKNCIAG